MTKDEFLENSDTLSFLEWFQPVVKGMRPIDFPHNTGVDTFLVDALNRYRWPAKRITIDTPTGALTLPRHASLSENAQVLDTLSTGIRSCLAASPTDPNKLAGWAKAIMQWGGVYTRRGNAPWLEGLGESIHDYFQRVLPALSADDCELIDGLLDLRSNAGTTKIHSLVLPDFIIYDSRVAAALAWLVMIWAEACDRPVPDHLSFGCMRANTQKKGSKPRSPDQQVFKYFVASGDVKNHRTHAMWNRHANWIVSRISTASSAKSDGEDRTGGVEQLRAWTTREIEAALFMMGEDLTAAMKANEQAKT